MTTPAEYARSYAQLVSRYWDGAAWTSRQTPIVNYLQHNGSRHDRRAGEAHRTLRSQLPGATGIAHVNGLATFTFDGDDYINHSIDRCFIGKACPWEIQETLQLLSRIGALDASNLAQYCNSALGIDCGGFVANYWGEGCPHLTNVSPYGWSGILPRSFWSARHRRRRRAGDVDIGDAAVFFKDVIENNPDIAKHRDSATHALIAGTGSEAFHIGLVSNVGYAGDDFTLLEIAESAGERGAVFGGDGVNVHTVRVQETGLSGDWVYAKTGANTWVYFVAPPAGWGPEMAHRVV